jgi:hypothetical protein
MASPARAVPPLEEDGTRNARKKRIKIKINPI